MTRSPFEIEAEDAVQESAQEKEDDSYRNLDKEYKSINPDQDLLFQRRTIQLTNRSQF